MRVYKIKRIIFILIIVITTHASYGEIYRWVDQNGKVHFGDKKPKHLESERLQLKINTYTSVTYDEAVIDYGEKKVVMYSTDWCGYCKKARKYFSDNFIPFTEYDIEKNRTARIRYKKMGATGVPVITVGKKRMNGFSIKGFQRIYN